MSSIKVGNRKSKTRNPRGREPHKLGMGRQAQNNSCRKPREESETRAEKDGRLQEGLSKCVCGPSTVKKSIDRISHRSVGEFGKNVTGDIESEAN